MNGIGQTRKLLLHVRKRFECSHVEQAVLAGVYERLVPEVRSALSQRPRNAPVGKWADRGAGHFRSTLAIGGRS